MIVRVARILLLLAALANLVLALSMPASTDLMQSQQVNLVAFVMGTVLCTVAFFQLRRRPERGSRLAVIGGILGLLMMSLNLGSLQGMMRQGRRTGSSALVPLAARVAMILAAACLFGLPREN